jgi:gas vesicle protein
MSDESNAGEKLLFFVIGGFVGAAIGMLFAPKSGEETRAYLANRAKDGSEFLASRAKEGTDYLVNQKQALEERASTVIEQGKELLNRQRESIAAAIEAGKLAYKEERSKTEA